MKQVIDLRPVYHRKEDRIRAHVILCWLALLLIRIAETTTGTTWTTITDELDLLTLGTFTGPAGTFRQTTELTKSQRDLLAKLKIAHPEEDHRGHTGKPLTSSNTARLVTRPVTTPACVRAGQTPDPGTIPDSHLRNAGQRTAPPSAILKGAG